MGCLLQAFSSARTTRAKKGTFYFFNKVECPLFHRVAILRLRK